MAVTVVASAWVGTATAQEGSGSDLIIQGNPGDVSTGSPRENVRGGALAERRPGLRIQAAITRHVNYQQNSLHAGGGGEPGDEPEVEPYVDLLVQLINAIFDALDELFLQLLTGPIDTVDNTQEAADGS
jgi:hypothetical protein